MFQSILFTTDLSDLSWAGLFPAAHLSQRLDVRLDVLSVVEEEFGFTVSRDITAGLEEWLEQAKASAQSQIEERLADQQVTADVRLITGFGAARQVVKFAEKHKPGLIVMATHGRSGFTRFLLGSTAERVVETAPCPVLTCHPESDQVVALQAFAPRRILLATDLSEESWNAVPYAAELATRLEAELVALCVVEEPYYPLTLEFNTPYVRMLEEVAPKAKLHIADQLKKHSVEARVEIGQGHNAADSIVEQVRDLECDLVVLAARGRSGPARYGIGGTTRKVIRNSPVPVLTVR
jgi:nucleotide-binding universal stress UspA family protein